MGAGQGRADVRRRPERRLDAADPRHPQAEGRQGDVLHRRRERRDEPAPRAAHPRRGPRDRQSHLHASQYRRGIGRRRQARAERHAAAGRSAHRPLDAAVPAPVLRRCRADDAGRDRAGEDRAVARLCDGRPAGRSRTTGRSRQPTRSSSGSWIAWPTPIPRRAGRSCCCTMPAAIASHTVAALPRIIDGLRAKGLEIVPVSELAGWTLRSGHAAGAAGGSLDGRQLVRLHHRELAAGHHALAVHACHRPRPGAARGVVRAGDMEPLQGGAAAAARGKRRHGRLRADPGLQRGQGHRRLGCAHSRQPARQARGDRHRRRLDRRYQRGRARHVRVRSARHASHRAERRQSARRQCRPRSIARRGRRRTRRRHPLRARYHRASGALVRRRDDRRRRRQRQGRQSHQPDHALAGARVHHRAEPRTARARGPRHDHRRPRRGRRLAALGAGRSSAASRPIRSPRIRTSPSPSRRPATGRSSMPMPWHGPRRRTRSPGSPSNASAGRSARCNASGSMPT